MQLVDPDILAEARTGSPGLLGTALALGLLLWLLGTRGYRFWVVLVTTVAAGYFGLRNGPTYGMQPLVAGLLLGLAAGALALALARMAVFAVGGIAALGLRQALAPGWDEPLVCFLAGGLIGVCFFRLWISVLASFTGSMILFHAGLALADHLGFADSAGLVKTQGPLLSWACLATAALGFLIQFLLERLRRARKAAREREEEEEEELEVRHRSSQAKSKAWWSRGKGRKAG
jgi:hypothetical protein